MKHHESTSMCGPYLLHHNPSKRVRDEYKGTIRLLGRLNLFFPIKISFLQCTSGSSLLSTKLASRLLAWLTTSTVDCPNVASAL